MPWPIGFWSHRFRMGLHNMSCSNVADSLAGWWFLAQDLSGLPLGTNHVRFSRHCKIWDRSVHLKGVENPSSQQRRIEQTVDLLGMINYHQPRCVKKQVEYLAFSSSMRSWLNPSSAWAVKSPWWSVPLGRSWERRMTKQQSLCLVLVPVISSQAGMGQDHWPRNIWLLYGGFNRLN